MVNQQENRFYLLALSSWPETLRNPLAKANSQWPRAAALHLCVLRRLLKQLAAIMIGNAIYFLALMPHLPSRAQHQPDRLDLGLLVDFWICVVIYGLIELVARMLRKSATS